MKQPSLLFWGTPEFALPSLKKMHEGGFNIQGAVTNPDEPTGRKQIITPSPIKRLADHYKIPVFQPAHITPEFIRDLPTVDLFVVVAFGKFLPKELIQKPHLGALNVHPSLLPRWRGPSPLQSAILHGDTEFGVTIMQIDELMDHGPILVSEKLKVKNEKVTYTTLHDELASSGANLLIETLPKWFAGEIKPLQQDDAQATFSKILKKDDGRINWSRSAEEIDRMVRAFEQWPTSWTLWPSRSKIYRIKIEEAAIIDDESPHGVPGFTWSNNKSPFLVKTGRGSLILKRITIEGKNSLLAEEIVRGYPELLGSTFV